MERLGRDTLRQDHRGCGAGGEVTSPDLRNRGPSFRVPRIFCIGSSRDYLPYDAHMCSTISVVIVAGACGIAAGTPLAILGAIGRAAQDGVIIKGGLYLEKLAEVDTILLDKTGTLTYGTPQVMEIQPANGVSPSSLSRPQQSQSRNPNILWQSYSDQGSGIGYSCATA